MNNAPAGWLDDYATIGLDTYLIGTAKYQCATGFVGHMVSSGDGQAHANYDSGRCSFNGGSENRKAIFGPIAASMGYDSGIKFFERVGYTKATDGSGNYVNNKGKSQLDGMLQAKWAGLPFNSLGSGTTPDFIKYDILFSALRDQCSPRDGIFNNPKSPNASGPDILTLVDAGGNVGKFAVQAADDSRGVTVGINTNAGESKINGQLSCGSIKQALMNGALSNAYAAVLKVPDPSNPSDTVTSPATGGAGGTSVPTCLIGGVGWIVCPVVKFIAQVVDAAYKVVDSLLTVQPVVTSSDGKGIYGAWSMMRNFANVAFVIAFLVIIFSQLTSTGITNYGIKKMLPRLVVAAILVNTSFWICAIAVDISNIVGASITGLFKSLQASLVAPGALPGTSTGNGWEGIAGGVLAGTIAVGVTLFVGLTALLPLLIAALIAIVTAFLVLTLRQALIVILIVVAPLAFVAYLLPNTESLFKKWRNLFQVLLLMYPIIGLIFGGSALASQIIMNSASGDPSQKITIQLMGAGVAIIPLMITPIIMKVSGGVLGKFGAFVNNPNKGPFDRMRKGAEGYRKNRQQLRDARALNGGPRFGKSIVQRKARREAVLSQRERNYNNARSGYIADASLSTDTSRAQQVLEKASGGRLGGKTKGDQLLDSMANGGGSGARSAALSQALTIQQKLEAEEVTAAQATIKALNLNQNERRTLGGGGSIVKNGTVLDASSNVALQRAGMQSVIESADFKGMNDLIDSSRGWTGETGDKLRQSLADSLASSGNKPGYVGQGKLEEIRQGINTQSTQEIVEKAIKDNVYSPAKIAAADKDELNIVANVAATSTSLSVADKQKLVDSAHNALTDPELARTISKNLENVQHVRTNTAPPPLL